MKRLLLTLTLALLAAPALAVNPYGACNAAAISLGACRPGSFAWFAFDTVDAATSTLIIDWALDEGNYQPTVPCAQSEVRSRRVLIIAGVDEGGCLAGEIGTEVSNPQSGTEFAYIFIRNLLRDRLIAWQQSAQEADAIEALPPIAEPGFGDGN